MLTVIDDVFRRSSAGVTLNGLMLDIFETVWEGANKDIGNEIRPYKVTISIYKRKHSFKACRPDLLENNAYHAGATTLIEDISTKNNASTSLTELFFEGLLIT